MALDRNLDDSIARAARTLFALAFQPHGGAGLDPGGKLEVDRLAVGQGDALRREGRGVDEGNLEAIADVGALALGRRRTPPAAEAAAGAGIGAAAPPEQPFEQVAQIDIVTAAHSAEILGPETALSTRAAGASAKPAAAESSAEGRFGIALEIDFAAIELPALVLVGQQVVCLGRLGELLRRGWIVLVAIGMQLLRQFAIGALDRFLVRRARHAKDCIGICHKRLS